jgi:cyclic pyranopterin phosphate synthase
VTRLALAPSAPDRLGRPLRDLRISVTDRCNFRCTYCMPREVFGPDHPFLPRAEILSFEEIARLAAIFVGLGVRKIRLTGGEPLLRRDLPTLVGELAALPGVDLALTTNGSLLSRLAPALRAAGLTRVSVSLDALDDGIFRRMNDADFPVERVLAGIDAALAAGFPPPKINAVVRRGVNEGEIVPLVRRFAPRGHPVRFIEFMDVGTTNGWRLDDVVPAREIVARLAAELRLEPVAPAYRGEVARRFRLPDLGGEVGLVTSVSQPFCGDCTRARLSADGRLFTCLFAAAGIDLRGPLRDGLADAELERIVTAAWAAREDRYSELRAAATPAGGKVEMSYIGG